MFGLSLGKIAFYLIIAAAIIFSLWQLHRAIYNSGYKAGYAELIEYKKNQIEKTLIVEKEVEKVVKEIEVRYVDRIKEVKVRGEQIIVKVPVYITKEDDRACELRRGFVRAHDSAASGTDPAGTPGEPSREREPSDVALSDATRIIAENYATCRIWRAQVEGWDEFWQRYSAALAGAVCVPR